MIDTENIGFKILFFQMGPKIFLWGGGPGPAAQELALDEEIPSPSGLVCKVLFLTNVAR